MFKKIRKFIKNKNGDFAIFALCVIPVLLLIFTSVITSGYRESAIHSKMQTVVDNGALIASKDYAYIVSGLEQDVCHFSESLLGNSYEDDYTATFFGNDGLNFHNKESFIYAFSSYLSKSDGFNQYWRTSYTIIIEDDGAESVLIELYYVIPKFKNSFAVVDELGIEEKTGSWYSRNPKTWALIKESLYSNILNLPAHCSEQEWKSLENKADVIAGVVSVTTSCL